MELHGNRSTLRRPLAALVLGLLPVAGWAGEPRTWHFTGAELVAALEGRLPSQVREPALRRLSSSSYGQAYIRGIADQTQGRLWCMRGGVLPHELGDRVYAYLSGLPELRLQANAGPLVGEALRRAFPCREPAVARSEGR